MLFRYLSRLGLILLMLMSSTLSAAPITFNLENTAGPVTQDNFKGKYILLAIGYTSCPDICPTTLYEYANMLKQLHKPEALAPLFVSIDPVHDTAETMQAYTQYFDKRIIGLTGTMDNIKALTQQLGATFGYRLNGKRVEIPTKDSGYTVYHSALIYLLDPKGELLDVYDYQIGADDLAVALNKVLDNPTTPALHGTHQDHAMGTATKEVSHTQEVQQDTHTNPSEETLAASTAQGTQGKNTTANHASNHNSEQCPLPKGFTALEQDVQLKDIYPEVKQDKVALLNLWALWCAPCRIELPLLNQFAKESQNMSVYALNLGDKKADIQAHFDKNHVQSLATHSTSDSRLLKKLGGKGLPFNALFVNGKQIAYKNGIIEETQSLSQFAECVAQH